MGGEPLSWRLAAHKRWKIIHEGWVWSAVARPTPTAVEVIVGPRAEQLADKLDAEDR